MFGAICWRFRLKALFLSEPQVLLVQVEFSMVDDKEAQINAETDTVRNRELGPYLDLFSAKSSIEGQDGGIVTALLLKGFSEGFFDAAIVVKRMAGYSAEATIATDANEVLAAKGTKYLRVNITEKLRELIDQGKKRIAIVCIPCQAEAARRIQQTVKGACEVTIIGLFCFEAFNPAKLKEDVKAGLGVDLDRAEKTQIRQGKFTATVDSKEYSCRVKDLHGAVEKACLFCDKFTAEAADVSVGSVGSKKGYSTVIIRTPTGQKVVENLDVEKVAAHKEEVAKISELKQERARANLAAAKQQTDTTHSA